MKTKTLLVTLLASLAAACSDDASGGGDPATSHQTVRSSLERDVAPDPSAALLADLASGNRELALDLYRQTAEPGANYFASPVSIQQAFALVYAGARGQTATEIASVLHFGDDAAAFHEAMNAFDLALTERNLPEDTSGDDTLEAVQLSVANAFWGQSGYPWLAPYLDVLALNYGAGIEALDFETDPEGSRQTINAWVEDRTQDRIVDLLPEGSITPGTAAVLTNAIYFKAPWGTKFNPDQTESGPFTLADGSTVSADLMQQLDTHLYAEGDGWQAVELGFRGDALAMLVVVPESDAFASIDTTIDGAQLDAIVAALEPMQVNVTLPKFTFETEFTLSEALQTMGMTTAFSDACDLSGMLEGGGLYIDEAYHKAFIAVDEGGAEAAAATAVVVGETSVPTEDAVIRADRPFFFAIRDRETGLILFWGRVMDPTA